MADKKDFSTVLVSRKENFATITLNNPDKLNALSPELFEDLKLAFSDIENDDTVRAVIITGAGESFSAGGDVVHDIDPLRSMSKKELKDYLSPLADLYSNIYNFKKPTIAAINGFALGAGMELALVCDIRIAADNMKMGEFFVRMGLVPEAGMCLLPKIVGLGMAKLLCMTGNLVEAKEAERIGLVEQVVPHDELISSAEKLASRLARGPASISIIKRNINKFSEMRLEDTVDAAMDCQFEASRTEDHAKAVQAFLEKKKPVFTGK